jgi:hypothetical protein
VCAPGVSLDDAKERNSFTIPVLELRPFGRHSLRIQPQRPVLIKCKIQVQNSKYIAVPICIIKDYASKTCTALHKIDVTGEPQAPVPLPPIRGWVGLTEGKAVAPAGNRTARVQPTAQWLYWLPRIALKYVKCFNKMTQ